MFEVALLFRSKMPFLKLSGIVNMYVVFFGGGGYQTVALCVLLCSLTPEVRK